MKKPQIWHYGLVARYWAEFETEGGPDAAYYEKLIKKSGQPALDLGCGSGRLLLLFLRAGLEVDGCDVSGDMIAAARQRADQEGFAPRLAVQGMHELDLPHRYRTIFSRGMVGLGGEHRLTMQGMHRAYEHLREGGTFAFDYMPRWNDPPAWMSRLPEGRRNLPQDWPTADERLPLTDGTEIELTTRTIMTDPFENVAARQIRVRLWRRDEVLQEEIHTQRLDDYTKNELVLMLERAGFNDIQIFGDFSDEQANADHYNLVFVCRK
jgi:SAM-dependent methyltransferase